MIDKRGVIMKKEKNEKTNAMRLLDMKKIPYITHSYPHNDELPLGLDIATYLNKDPKTIFKTLICVSNKKQYYVFVVGCMDELDLKKCAKAVNEKNVELISVKDIHQVSGYIRGGCSPIGMKKQYLTVFDESCLQYETISFSAGKIGYQIEANPQMIISLLNACVADIAKDHESPHLHKMEAFLN